MSSELKSNSATPLLFLGDGPDSHTGLGRIGHDLAWLASSMPEFRVGYLGRQGFGRARFPWTQYSFGINEQWGEHRLQEAWDDLAGDQQGIIFTCWDLSRLLWFADGRGTGLEPFLNSGRFQKWAYCMADATGVNPNSLPQEQAHALSQYNRALLASHWAFNIASDIAGPELDWMPHPINREVFKPVDGNFIRSAWNIQGALVGCVMTNQARKHWPTVMEAFSLLSEQLPVKPKLWIHPDLMLHYWDLNALAIEYGIASQIIYEGRPLSDRELAMRYSACDVTVVISGGEGFGYPVAESLSCGTPCLTGSYGAQSELTHWTVRPVATVIDTNHNVRRAVYRGCDVMEGLIEVLAMKPKVEMCVERVAHLDMKLLWVQWQKWFRKGLQ